MGRPTRGRPARIDPKRHGETWWFAHEPSPPDAADPALRTDTNRPLVAELIRHDVITADEVVAHDVRFEEVSMSHAAYLVSVDGALRAFVKRCDPARSGGRTLHAEANVYRLADQHPALASVVPHPSVVSADDQLLVLEALPVPPDGSTWPLGGPVLDPTGGHAALRAYGCVVAAVHSVRPPAFGERPWMLHGLDFDRRSLASLPRPVQRVYGRVASDALFRRAFARAARHWRMGTLVHGDLRWSNVIPSSGDGPSDTVGRVWLVDWELACVGDPAWDVGAVLADIVGTAMIHRGTPMLMDEFAATAGPFLDAYRREARVPHGSWNDFLVRCTLQAGIRLIQTVTEYGHVDPAEMARIEPLLMPWSAELAGQPEAVGSHLAQAAGS